MSNIPLNIRPKVPYFEDPKILDLRNLERRLFRAWCIWLCNPSLFRKQEKERKAEFQLLPKEMEKQILSTFKKCNRTKLIEMTNANKDYLHFELSLKVH